jgi:hypothetical protein
LSEVIKHLEFIQAVITRLANNSFSFKGWAVTVVVAVLALAGQGQGADKLGPNATLVGMVPAVAFWWLDALCVRRERLFRCLYDEVRTKASTDFSMDVRGFAKAVSSTFGMAMSGGLLGFYGLLALVVVTLRILKHLGVI